MEKRKGKSKKNLKKVGKIALSDIKSYKALIIKTVRKLLVQVYRRKKKPGAIENTNYRKDWYTKEVTLQISEEKMDSS